MSIIAIDPGAVHCGVAIFRRDEIGWRCGTSTHTPHLLLMQLDFPGELCGWGEPVKRAIIESFRLYPWAMQGKAMSDLKEVQTIGALRWVIGKRKIPITMQAASIKKPTRAILRSKGIVLQGKGTHERDAELHGWHYILKKGVSA